MELLRKKREKGGENLEQNYTKLAGKSHCIQENVMQKYYKKLAEKKKTLSRIL